MAVEAAAPPLLEVHASDAASPAQLDRVDCFNRVLDRAAVRAAAEAAAALLREKMGAEEGHFSGLRDGMADFAEITAGELVRSARQQDPEVQDSVASAVNPVPLPRLGLPVSFSPDAHQAAPPASSSASEVAVPAQALQPRRAGRRTTASEPPPLSPGTSCESPTQTPTHAPSRRRRRMPSSASAPALSPGGGGGIDKLEHTRLPPIEQQSPGRQQRKSLLQQPHSPQRGHSLLQDELRNLPVAEALRQILIERTGSLKQAYKAMDVNGGGVVNPVEFEQGLLKARVFGSPLVGYRDAHELFRGIDQSRHGVLSLQEFLGYMPMIVKKTRCRDTRAQWISYNNQTSAQKSRLVRQPCWKLSSVDRGDNDAEPDYQFAQRQRRELRNQLLGNQRGGLKMEEKRRLVKGLVAHEDRDDELQQHYRKMTEQTERIGNAIHSCSRARSELVSLQQAMVQLSPKTRRGKCRRGSTRSSLERTHTESSVRDRSRTGSSIGEA